LPFATELLAALIEMELRTALVTLNRTVFEVMPLNEAVTFVVPTVKALARPLELTVATVLFEELQLTVVVMFAVEPSP
jgi:hypothetical protein